MPQPTSVLFVQPYLPEYRKQFFGLLSTAAADRDIAIHVVAGAPQGPQRQRDDRARFANAPLWLHEGSSRVLELGELASFTHYGSIRAQSGFDAVVVPAAATCTDAIVAFGRRIRSEKVKLGLWGHFDAYVKPPNPVDRFIELAMCRRADALFAYTKGGANYLRENNVDSQKIVALNNTFDAVAQHKIYMDLASKVFEAEVEADGPPTLCFFGGLDEAKGIDFLVRVLDILARMRSKIRLVVGGTGHQEALLHRARDRGQVQLLGRVNMEEKSRLALSSFAIVNPGRIGLVAVDSLVFGIPIVTRANYAGHAPEVEYLEEGKSLHTFSSDPEEFARQLESLSAGGRRQEQWKFPTVEGMVAAAMDGIDAMLGR